MTKIIHLTLTNSATGTWTTELGYRLDGVTIPANQDYWQVAQALQPDVVSWFGDFKDAVVLCFDPGALDLDGSPSADPVCQFRILNGTVEAQV